MIWVARCQLGRLSPSLRHAWDSAAPLSHSLSCFASTTKELGCVGDSGVGECGASVNDFFLGVILFL